MCESFQSYPEPKVWVVEEPEGYVVKGQAYVVLETEFLSKFGFQARIEFKCSPEDLGRILAFLFLKLKENELILKNSEKGDGEG